MRIVLRSALETAIRDETEVQDHVSQTELRRRIDSSYRRVFDLLIQAFGQSYFRADLPATINVTAGSNIHDLPSDFYQEVAVRSLVDGTYYPVRKYMDGDQDVLLNDDVNGSGRRLYYQIVGKQKFSTATSFKDQIYLLPVPKSDFVVEVDYVPLAASFEFGGEVTYQDVNGWASDYIVADVSAFCMRKRQADASDYLRERDEVVGRIVAMRDARTSGTSRVRDVRTRRTDPGYFDEDEYYG